MVSKGYIPKDKVGAAELGMKLAKQMLPRRQEDGRPAKPCRPTPSTLPFYAGCAIPQDHELYAVVHEVAAGFGVRLEEAADAGCCGHPSRGTVDSLFASRGARLHRVPRLRRQPRGEPASRRSRSGTRSPSAPAAARRSRCSAAGDRFVPYVGCLADRDAALASLGDAAEQAGAEMAVDYPTLHNGCCGALGGMYRGATKSQRAAPGVRRAAAGARRHDVRALPRQPPLGRARTQDRRPRPLLARVLPGRPHRPRGAHR